MFYIVEEDSKLQLIENLVRQGCYIDVVSSNDNYHPKLTSTVAVYLRFPKSKSGFIIPISHDEGVNVDKKRVYDILLQAPTLYTLDKKKLLYHFNLPRAIDISLLYSMVKYERLEYSKESNTLNFFYNKHKKLKGVNSFIPISKLYEVCENVYDKVAPAILLEIPSGFDFYNNTATSVFYLLEQEGLGIEYEEYVKLFTPREPQFNTVGNTVYTYYNLYNSTSRPTNAFNSVNYAAIPKTEAHRACFTPQNDFFVEFDFDGYHLRLLCEQIGYKLTPESAHKQLAKHYFGTENISDEQYLEAKQINFQAIYGKIPKEHRNLDIFVLIQDYIDSMWTMYEENGVVYNPVSGKPFTKELQDMHPAKLMNYMMQSLETSRNILILKEVLKYLRDKKTTAVLFTYDAILFDYSKEDGKETLIGIQKVLEQDGKYPVKFKYSKDLVL